MCIIALICDMSNYDISIGRIFYVIYVLYDPPLVSVWNGFPLRVVILVRDLPVPVGTDGTTEWSYYPPIMLGVV